MAPHYQNWWINFDRFWLTCPRKAPLDPRAKVFVVRCLLDYDSCDIYLWLGWFGFRIWWLMPETCWMSFTLSSGVSIHWGRMPLVEGSILSKHEDTLRWVSPDTRWRQVSIAGENYFLPDDRS